MLAGLIKVDGHDGCLGVGGYILLCGRGLMVIVDEVTLKASADLILMGVVVVVVVFKCEVVECVLIVVVVFGVGVVDVV